VRRISGGGEGSHDALFSRLVDIFDSKDPEEEEAGEERRRSCKRSR
jgi:hypothetical protein